jgi:hypothetical protein
VYAEGLSKIALFDRNASKTVEQHLAGCFYRVASPCRRRRFSSSASNTLFLTKQALRFWELAPETVIVLLNAGTYRAALDDTDFSEHLSGSTGEGKSELAAL